MDSLAKPKQTGMQTGGALPAEILEALASREPVSGHTHNFYRYPARFSPVFVREVIRNYSKPGEVVFDPFMGGGTTVVEALALGRKAIGVDLNTLAHFVSLVKTTPLTQRDIVLIDEWLCNVEIARPRAVGEVAEPVRNLPRHLQLVWSDLAARVDVLPFERQRQFVRCALLKMGQWAIDCKDSIPSSRATVEQFSEHLREMMKGVEEFVAACLVQGVNPSKIRQNRLLLCRSTIGLESEARVRAVPRPTLVVTSPPYPAVHILYHRWQVQGRRETAAPYWLAALKDGHAASHYTFGSRSPLGLENYFRNAEQCFRSVRQVVADNALVVQLVAFSDIESQLPRYLTVMEEAGFRESDTSTSVDDSRTWRRVPNRKWYCHNGREQNSAKEVVLFHRPA